METRIECQLCGMAVPTSEVHTIQFIDYFYNTQRYKQQAHTVICPSCRSRIELIIAMCRSRKGYIHVSMDI